MHKIRYTGLLSKEPVRLDVCFSCHISSVLQPEKLGDLESFERYLMSSQELEKLDEDVIKKWTEDKEMQIVNFTIEYRLEINKYKEQSVMIRRDDLKVKNSSV